jgi:hypothetical protein
LAAARARPAFKREQGLVAGHHRPAPHLLCWISRTNIFSGNALQHRETLALRIRHAPSKKFVAGEAGGTGRDMATCKKQSGRRTVRCAGPIFDSWCRSVCAANGAQAQYFCWRS